MRSRKCAQAVGQTRWLKSTIQLVRRLTIQTNGFNDVTAALNAILHAACVSLMIMCVSGAVRMGGILAVGAAYLAFADLVGYGTLAESYAEINEASEALLEDVRRTVSIQMEANRGAFNRAFNREIRCMRKLRVTAGSTFYYDRPLLLTIVAIVLSQSVNLLIMK